jgi:DNA polymerase III subunit gamma/tau
MSYLVLARKYRPQTFEEVVSQSHISSTLQNAIKQQRLSHAYLFTGTRGTGKTTTARLLAKALNCETGPTPVPCNKCSNCLQITKSSSMDVLEIDAASRTSVENIRELQESVHYSPTSSPYKIYIIDEVHRLSGNAFDALLKTLEEPPSHVIFIFATTDPQKLPATILSRCQRYDFRRIPFREMNSYLRKLADKEKINIDDDALALIAQKGDGSLRDALSIFEQVIACAEDKITRETIAETLGLVDLDLLFNLTDTIVNKDSAGALSLVENMFASGVDISQFITDFQEHFRKILIVNSSDTPFDYLAVSDYFQEKYLAFKDKFSDNDIFRVVKMLSDLQADLKAGADPAIFLEIAVLRLVKLESSIMLEDVLRKLSQLESTGSAQGPNMFAKSATSLPSAPNPDTARNNSTPPPVKKTPPLKPDPEKKTNNPGDTPSARMATPLTWNDFVKQVKGEKHMLGDFLSYGELTRMDSESIELTYSANGDVYHNHISKKENQRILEKHMLTVFGKSLRLITRVDKSLQPEKNTNGADPRYDITPEELFKKKPELKEMADRLGGEIKAVKMFGNKGEENG